MKPIHVILVAILGVGAQEPRFQSSRSQPLSDFPQVQGERKPLDSQDPSWSRRILTVEGVTGSDVLRVPMDLFTSDIVAKALATQLGLVESLRAAGREAVEQFEIGLLVPDAAFRVGDLYRVETYDRIPLLVSQKLLIDCERDLKLLASDIAELLERKRAAAAGPPWSVHPTNIQLEDSGSANYERITIRTALATQPEFSVELIITRRQGTPRYQASLQGRQFDSDGLETSGGAADLFVDEVKRVLRAAYPARAPK